MRHVVYLLVVLNLVFLGWNIFQSQAAMQAERNLPPIPESVAPLVTLREQQATDAEVSAIEKLTDAKPPGAGAGFICQTLGPFLVLDALQEAETELLELGLTPERRESERKHPIGYWVYLPEMAYSESQRLTQILDDHSDKEYFVGKGNVVSLGAFQEMSRARKRLERTRKLGLDPLLETRYRTTIGYWLDFQTEIAKSRQLDNLVTEGSDIWLQDRACH